MRSMTQGSPAEGAPSGRWRLAAFVTAACVLMTLPRLLLHELWRDEAWLWRVVTESRTLPELFAPLARSGQGNLFPVLCFLARQVSTSPRAMQALHLVLVAAALSVFLRWAPLARRERVLFVLGYFPFYEYAVISRHYVAGAFLAWLACAATRWRRPVLVLGLTLGLLCQTTVYGFLLAIAIACGAALDRLLRRDEAPPILPVEAALGLALGLGGAVAGLLQLRPLPGTSFAPGWTLGWDAGQAVKTLAMPWRAFVPVPRFGLHFWNTNILDPWPLGQAAAGVLTLGVVTALLWRKRVALVTFLVGMAGLLAFGYVKYVGVSRHQGHGWLLLFAALWLGGGLGEGERGRSWRSRLLLALLVVHVGVGVYASFMDLRHPFSNGAAAAELVREKGLAGAPLLGHREPPAATVSLYLGEPLYSPSRKRFVTYPDWGPEQREMNDLEVRCAARDLTRREGRDGVLVINRELPPWPELVPEGFTAGAIVATEDYHLYRLPLARLAATRGEAGCPGEAP